MGVSEFKAKWGIIDHHDSRFACVWVGGDLKIVLKTDYPVKQAAPPWDEIYNNQHVCHTSRLDCFHLLCLAAAQLMVTSSKINITVSSKAEAHSGFWSHLLHLQLSPPCDIFKFVLEKNIFFAGRTQPNRWKRTETCVSSRFRGWPS